MPSNQPARRFAILEHRWEGTHWDFLIEDDQSTLRTWAIDQPIIEGIALPARALAAHRRIYLEYEGAISGNRGTVHRWDQGVASVLVWTELRVSLKVEGVQLVGVVDLWVEGGEADAEGPRLWLFRFGKLS